MGATSSITVTRSELPCQFCKDFRPGYVFIVLPLETPASRAIMTLIFGAGQDNCLL